LDLSRWLTGRRLTGVLEGVAAAAGFHVTRRSNTLRWKRNEVLRRLGPKVVLDVGANTGQWAGEVLGDGFRGKVISFEPCPGAYAELARKAQGVRHTCLAIGLGAEDGRAEFFVTKGTVNSSFLKPVERTMELNRSSGVAEKREVEIRRLDGVIKELGLAEERLYLKIDTQGYEREVLHGASETLMQADAVEVELSLVELYEGQGLLPDVWEMLTGAGFRPAWVERGFRDPADIWMMQVDGLFVREDAWSS
jgi:FkbM family methyltransferase